MLIFERKIVINTDLTGSQWWTIHKGITPDDRFALGHVILMLIFDAIIYLLIALYVEAVFPGEYGVPLPWYFPFTGSYWCGLPKYVGKTFHSSSTYAIQSKRYLSGVGDLESGQNGSIPNYNHEIYESEPADLPIGVKMLHLRKEFRKKKVAVRDLSLNLYEGQITVLLGHNGAGKTTTMSMLTGT